jgi:penicillin-binding protein 1C
MALNNFVRYLKNRKLIFGIGILVFLLWYSVSLPSRLFNNPYSTVLEASNGQLLTATIAADGQWRFPHSDSVPEKFAEAIIAFEDKRFYSHPGIDLLSMGRAFRQNIGAGKIISGGSTISMQVIRLSRQGTSRTVFEKAYESILATRLELRYSKSEILSLYAAHAPFGGNVVGLQAACWRYFGTNAADLSWAEATLLAVLPNAPALIHPGKNRDLLKAKRDRLLDKLQRLGKIDAFTCQLAKEESIPDQPLPLPVNARHLLLRMANDGRSQKQIRSTIDQNLQLNIETTVDDHHQNLRSNQVHNAAAIVIDVKTGNILAYVGNVESGSEHGAAVDMIAARRSTGSILKPFLYAAMLEDGLLLPKTLVSDVPTMINGFAPKNFSRQYDGAVHADQALIRSLNIPAVHELKDYHHQKFHQLLKDLGMTTLSQPADHYGLSLILGGAEGTLFDITGMYASMARSLTNYFEYAGQNRYRKQDYHQPRYVERQSDEERSALEISSRLSASSVYLTFDALKEVYRPGEETGWRYFHSARQIAWKTGTSFGYRDGWAIGVTPEYAVGVWVGNADGEGRPGLTGTDAASPLMFNIFSRLPSTSWFDRPLGELQKVVTCKKSGHRISTYCEERDTIYISKAGLNTNPCPYHQLVHITTDSKFRLHSDCAPVNAMKHRPWFVLPPVQEFYFKSKNLGYHPLPPFRKDCQPSNLTNAMDMIYPRPNARIFIPREMDGQPGSSVFELAHQNPGSSVYWHLDGEYIGSTKITHHLPFQPGEGKHVLTVIDDHGESLQREFEVISKM